MMTEGVIAVNWVVEVGVRLGAMNAEEECKPTMTDGLGAEGSCSQLGFNFSVETSELSKCADGVAAME
jgi:hypothetical protein